MTSENLTNHPSSWVLEASNDNAPESDDAADRPEPQSVTVSVSSTSALADVLTAAGFEVKPSRFPGLRSLSYIKASRPGSYLSFRAPNADEPVPAASDEDRQDAEDYRYLRELISETMTEPDEWDGDDSESYILGQYIKWLANGRPVNSDGYPDHRSNAEARRPDPYKAVRLTAEALDLAESYFDNPDEFELSMQGVLERVRDDLAQIRDALTGHAEPDDAEIPPQTEAPRMTADAVVIGDDGGHPAVLCIRRRWEPYGGCWALPGGYVDQGEDPRSSARRELREEAGLSVGALDAVGVYADPERDPRGRYVSFAYMARVDGAPEPTPGDDATETQWVWIEHLVNRHRGLAFDHADIVKDAARLAGLPVDAWAPPAHLCQYKAAHTMMCTEAVTVIDCGPAGRFPACRECANLYAATGRVPRSMPVAPLLTLPAAAAPRLETLDQWGRLRCQLMVAYVDEPQTSVQCGMTEDHDGECDPLPVWPDADELRRLGFEPNGFDRHEHHFPMGAPDADGYADPADCECGMTYAQYDAEMGERIAADLESRADAATVIHDLDGTGQCAADCSGCEIERN